MPKELINMRKYLFLLLLFTYVSFFNVTNIFPYENNTGDYIRTGSIIIELTNGDYVLPKFSPNGKYLAYSEVISDSNSETTQLLLLNLSDNSIDTILKPNTANKYATYKSFAIDLSWSIDGKYVFVTLHDGDVNSYKLKINILTHNIVSVIETPEYRVLPNEQKRLLSKLIKMYPEICNDAFDNIFSNNFYLYIPKKGVILQKSYANEDNDIWYLDYNIHNIKKLIPLKNEDNYSFGGGASCNQSAVFVIKKDSLAQLYTYIGGSINYLSSFQTTIQTPTILTKKSTNNSVYYLLTTCYSYEKLNNPVFCFNGKTNKQLIDYQNIYDFDVSFTNKLIAICHWKNDKRYITIKYLLGI